MISCGLLEKKDCREMQMEIKARLFFGNLLSLGTSSGASKHCMCIHTRYRFPLHSWISLLIPSKNDAVIIPCEISGFSAIDGLHDTMSLEILNPPEEYLELVKSF